VSDALPASQAALDGDILYSSFRRPVKMVISGDDNIGEPTRRRHHLLQVPAALVDFGDADHGYTKQEHSDRLFAETVEWLEQHGRG
jgi:hypothetical protein